MPFIAIYKNQPVACSHTMHQLKILLEIHLDQNEGSIGTCISCEKYRCFVVFVVNQPDFSVLLTCWNNNNIFSKKKKKLKVTGSKYEGCSCHRREGLNFPAFPKTAGTVSYSCSLDNISNSFIFLAYVLNEQSVKFLFSPELDSFILEVESWFMYNLHAHCLKLV